MASGLSSPKGLAVDTSGSVYVVSDSTGVLTKIIGGGMSFFFLLIIMNLNY